MGSIEKQAYHFFFHGCHGVDCCTHEVKRRGRQIYNVCAKQQVCVEVEISVNTTIHLETCMTMCEIEGHKVNADILVAGAVNMKEQQQSSLSHR